jgi:hypothetical protein
LPLQPPPGRSLGGCSVKINTHLEITGTHLCTASATSRTTDTILLLFWIPPKRTFVIAKPGSSYNISPRDHHKLSVNSFCQVELKPLSVAARLITKIINQPQPRMHYREVPNTFASFYRRRDIIEIQLMTAGQFYAYPRRANPKPLVS